MIKRSYRNKKGMKPFLAIVMSLLIVIYAFVFVDRQIRPTVEALSDVQARIIGTQAINDGASEGLTEDIQYEDLMNIMKDDRGNITLIQANTVAINTISSDIASAVQEQMEIVSNKTLRIPLGNILGSQVLSSYGPKIDIEIIPVGSVVVDYYTEFEHAGINQTIHRIYLEVVAEVQIIAPLSNKGIDIVSKVPIAETVIVGKVPETYINIPLDHEALEGKDFLNFINE